MKAMFGDGSDGTVDLDGSTTPSWASRVGSTYTLARDIFCANLTISNNSLLKPAGFRIFVRTLLTIGAGSAIRDDGSDAAGGTGGAALAGAGPTRYAGSGGGGNGGSGMGGGSGQVAPMSGNSGLPPGMTTYNGGGGGSSGSGQNGGVGGTPYQLVDIPAPRSAAWFDQCILYGGSGGNVTGRLAQGSGGGGGGAVSGSTGGGGGGGGGGIVISAWEIDNDGEITADGGDGDDGSGPGAAGGGGGGSGGYVAILYNTATGGSLGTRHANGGLKGVAGGGGGSDGANGGNGPVIELQETT